MYNIIELCQLKKEIKVNCMVKTIERLHVVITVMQDENLGCF